MKRLIDFLKIGLIVFGLFLIFGKENAALSQSCSGSCNSAWNCNGACNNCYCPCAQMVGVCVGGQCDTMGTNYGTCFCGGVAPCNGSSSSSSTSASGGTSSSSSGGNNSNCNAGHCSCGTGGGPSCGSNSGCAEGVACCTNDDPPGCSAWGSCSPSCGSPHCGGGDGCGGSCSSSDNYWSNWGACSGTPSYSQSRSNACQGTQTQACTGTINGTIFDGSDYTSCPSSFTNVATISGAIVTATGVGSNYTRTTGADGAYSMSPVNVSENYTLAVTVPAGYVPAVKFNCNGTTANMTLNGQVSPRNFGYWRIYGGWWQAVGGSVHGGNGVQSIVPCSMPSNLQKMVLDDGSGNYGSPSYGDGNLYLGTCPSATVSTAGQNAASAYEGDCQNYNYFKTKMSDYDKSTWDNAPSKPNYAPSGGNDYQIYTYSGDIDNFDFSVAAGEKMIFLIDGNVTVTGDVDVPTTAGSPSFLAVIAKGTITFADNVTRAEGWWIGNSLTVASTGDTSTDLQFVGEGSFVGCNAITLSRDRGISNNSEVTEQFIFRPDLLINAPIPFSITNYIWNQSNP